MSTHSLNGEACADRQALPTKVNENEMILTTAVPQDLACASSEGGDNRAILKGER
jgi:hypothetical protein